MSLGKTFRRLATNRLAGGLLASMAVSAGRRTLKRCRDSNGVKWTPDGKAIALLNSHNWSRAQAIVFARSPRLQPLSPSVSYAMMS